MKIIAEGMILNDSWFTTDCFIPGIGEDIICIFKEKKIKNLKLFYDKNFKYILKDEVGSKYNLDDILFWSYIPSKVEFKND